MLYEEVNEENTDYLYYDAKGNSFSEKPEKYYAYEFVTPNGRKKYMAMQYAGELYDPSNTVDFSYKRKQWGFKTISKEGYQDYVKYLNPKTRSKYRILRAERCLR